VATGTGERVKTRLIAEASTAAAVAERLSAAEHSTDAALKPEPEPDRAAEHAAEADCLAIGTELPDASGAECLLSVREEAPDLPVVLPAVVLYGGYRPSVELNDTQVPTSRSDAHEVATDGSSRTPAASPAVGVGHGPVCGSQTSGAPSGAAGSYGYRYDCTCPHRLEMLCGIRELLHPRV